MGKGHFWYKIRVKRTVLFLKNKKGHFCQVKDTSVGGRTLLSLIFLICQLCNTPCFEKDSSVTAKDSSITLVWNIPKLKQTLKMLHFFIVGHKFEILVLGKKLGDVFFFVNLRLLLSFLIHYSLRYEKAFEKNHLFSEI